MSSLLTAQLYPKQALGFFVIGASLHDILTRLKAEPQRFPTLDLIYSQAEPFKEPVTVNLAENGIRLRFDGVEQRLRLIEVLDFSKNQISIKTDTVEHYLVRPSTIPRDGHMAEPTFKHIYQRFMGPSFNGEFIPNEGGRLGTYILSWPGVAFTFEMSESTYSPEKSHLALLAPTQLATSMAVYGDHESWAQAREQIWTEPLPSIKTFAPLARSKEVYPDEISLVKIHGGGKLQLFKRWTNAHVWVTLGETSPQDLVAELGPPDAIYRKNDQRMHIHKIRTTSNSRTRSSRRSSGTHDDPTDTDQSSAHAMSDEDSPEDVSGEGLVSHLSNECFYNYFYLGIDILISTPTLPSRPPPSHHEDLSTLEQKTREAASDSLVATKIILHGNVPGSYPFNRHRRCRWEITYLNQDTNPVNAESQFEDIQSSLRDEWQSIYSSDEEARQRQRGMVLNRGWGESPGSSCEFLGGWEDSNPDLRNARHASEDSTTTLFGFPGLVFEVLRNGFVSAVTVF